MLVAFPPIFMADTKFNYGYNFATTLKSFVVMKMLNCRYFLWKMSTIQMSIQNNDKHLRWSISQKQLTVESL